MIFSSHILSEVQTICDKILIIAKGKLVAFGDPESLEKQLLSSSEINLTAEAEAAEIQEITSLIPEITEVTVKNQEPACTTVCIKTDADDIHSVSRKLFFAFAKREKALLEMTLKKANLEDIFLELTDTSSAEETSDGQDLSQEEREDDTP